MFVILLAKLFLARFKRRFPPRLTSSIMFRYYLMTIIALKKFIKMNLK